MDYEGLKTFILYDARPMANYQFVMIKTLLIVEHATKESIAKDLQEANPNSDQNFRQVPVYDVLVNRGVVKESDGLYTLVDFDKFSAEQKKELVNDCKRRIEEVNEGDKIKEPNYFKIAPGEKASDWERQKELGIIGIGWKQLGDLTGLKFEQVKEKIKKEFPTNYGSFNPQFENFLNIKKGDIVVANKGKSKIVGIGKVTSEYQFESGDEFPNRYKVDWFYTKEKEIPMQSGWFVTVIPITVELYKTIISPKKPDSKTQISEETEELIEKFDKNPQAFDADWKWIEKVDRKNEHDEFVRKFAFQEMENIPIDRYVQGKPIPETGETNKTTFCYLLEQEKGSTGSIPGNAKKFGVYYDKEKKQYDFRKKYSSYEDAFTGTKHSISTILNAGNQFQEQKNWDKLSDIVDISQHDIHRHVRSKLLAVYFPEEFLAIHSKDIINKLLDFFKIPKTKYRRRLTLKQSKLLEVKNSHPIMKEWDVYKYSLFLFNAILPLIEEEDDDDPIDIDPIEYTIEQLPTPTSEDLKELKKELSKRILIKDDKLEEIISALLMGKGILLTGAVGTGKTDLAQILPEITWKEYGGYYSDVHTATSDWTTTEVVGGIHPKVIGEKITYEIKKGCVANTVSLNWKDKTSKSNERESYEARNSEGELQKFRGVWLVIDEFNRANIDKAFGQLFTALEYKKMKIPTVDIDESEEELIIPEDYRIIGTLNTADKHYLHSLSDALKRRFSIIELPFPEYSQKDDELYFVIKKATKELTANINLVLSDEEGKFARGKGDADAESIVDTLYTLFSFIREIKPLGTALLISMLRFMIINHSLDLIENKKWNASLDSALVSSIIPQIEDLPYWTLKVIRAAFCDDLEKFFVNDSEIKDDEQEKYKKDFQKTVKFISKIKGKNRKKIGERFMDGNLGKNKEKDSEGNELPDKDIEYLKIWTAENSGKKPSLPKFRNAIDQIISEQTFDEETEEEIEHDVG